MKQLKYDAIIIGSGQASNPLAHKLADLGWKAALIEKENLGGSCVNYGCTPTKTMLASARLAHYARKSPGLGVDTGPVTVDLAKIVARKNKLVQQWRDGQEHHCEIRPTLDVYTGFGRFTGPNTIAVNDIELESDHIFINTGARPRIIDLPGLDEVDYLTNRVVMDLTEAPEHLIVLGGSYIGLEFGQMYLRFGSRVTVVEYESQLVPREDEDVATALQDALSAEGMDFHLGAKATQVSRTEAGLELTIQYHDGRTEKLPSSHLLLATGRVPNTESLNLSAASVETDSKGYVVVNDRLETSVPGVWALGDVKGGPAFTNVAYDDHLIVYENLINGRNRSTKDRLAPYALFTDPELGRVGLTEKEARAAGYRLKVGTVPMSWVARAIERDETAGLMKVVINAEDDCILGAAILGTEGGELVQTLMALMMAGAPWTLFEKSVYIHPTLTEGFFTLMDNVKDIEFELADELFSSPDSDGAESQPVDDFFIQPELA